MSIKGAFSNNGRYSFGVRVITPFSRDYSWYHFRGSGHQSMQRRFDGHVYLVQTDGGPEFKSVFIDCLTQFCERHRVARPYRKNEQSYIESFNRTVRKECLGWNKDRFGQLADCQDLVESFLTRYHYHRLHISLGMTPPLTNKE
jgi:transposase InsO family protein